MTRNVRIIALLALLLAIPGVVAYKLSPRLAPADATLAVSSCDPGLQPCSAALPGGGQIELAIAPRPIRPLQALDLAVELSGLETRRVKQVEIDFAGSTMQMGYNRPVLAGAGGRFTGRTTLPVCLSGSMVWVVTVLLSTDNGRIAIPFSFTTAGR